MTDTQYQNFMQLIAGQVKDYLDEQIKESKQKERI